MHTYTHFSSTTTTTDAHILSTQPTTHTQPTHNPHTTPQKTAIPTPQPPSPIHLMLPCSHHYSHPPTPPIPLQQQKQQPVHHLGVRGIEGVVVCRLCTLLQLPSYSLVNGQHSMTILRSGRSCGRNWMWCVVYQCTAVCSIMCTIMLQHFYIVYAVVVIIFVL